GSTHGFPVALTSFVGRARAVDEIAGLLGQDRLVTVTGAGGAGKTRLAGEVARRVAGRFADGAWVAELAAVREPAQVRAAVTVLGERAGGAARGFARDGTTGAQVARLVARLDGMPLAIELAAARVDSLGVPQLLDRIDDRFELLADGDRLAQDRQRSLAAA